MPAPVRQGGTILEFPISLTYGGSPFSYGEPNQVGGATVTPLNLRFYVSNVELLAPGGNAVPVDVVSSTGQVQPYGVFMFNADDAGAQTLRVLAPAGTYAGVKFALGLNAACNSGTSSGRVFPLSDDSQMTWPHLAGYLFFRYEGLVTAPGASPDGGGPVPLPVSIHMGADLRDLTAPSALIIRVMGQIAVPSSGTATRRVQLAMDQVFKGAETAFDLSDEPLLTILGPEGAAGECLRRAAATLSLFAFTP